MEELVFQFSPEDIGIIGTKPCSRGEAVDLSMTVHIELKIIHLYKYSQKYSKRLTPNRFTTWLYFLVKKYHRIDVVFIKDFSA